MKMYLISDNIDTQTGMRSPGWTVWVVRRKRRTAHRSGNGSGR